MMAKTGGSLNYEALWDWHAECMRAQDRTRARKRWMRRLVWWGINIVIVLSWVIVLAGQCLGATARTKNFIVSTPNPEHAQEFAAAAEKYRRDLAVSWLGKAMPNWSTPCPIQATVGERFGGGAATSFVFDHGEVFGWRMTAQGSRAKILTAVLPHEITHMVLASHFRRPLPRWADEGAAMSVEPEAVQARYRKDLVQCLQMGRGIAFNKMVTTAEYPRDILPLYAQSMSAVDYLIQQGGRRKFVRFLEEAFRTMRTGAALRTVYSIPSTPEFQSRWLAWVKQGSPRIGAENFLPAGLAARPRQGYSTPMTVASAAPPDT